MKDCYTCYLLDWEECPLGCKDEPEQLKLDL